ncbi:MAG: glycosyltransferase family 2 protein [Candidatus Berkelbacteria bacterium]
MVSKIPTLAIVIPCFNEEAVLEKTILALVKTLDPLIKSQVISKQSYILFVDDGSRDKTWAVIEKAKAANAKINGMKLTRNFGHQQALVAGLSHAKKSSDVAITLDADLQDDPKVIGKFVEAYKEGNQVVYGVRKERKQDSIFKRCSATFFYRLMKTLGVEIVYNHADYRLMSRSAIEHLEQFHEVNLFLRGIVPLIGLSSATVYYDRVKRVDGDSKYTLHKMISFAWDAITSFSIKPLRIITIVGFLIFVFSLAAGAWVLVELIKGNAIHGWASTVLPIYFIGGIQILSIGIIGEYLGKIYKEVKSRPRYIIEKEI